MTETEKLIGDALQSVVLPLNPAAAFEVSAAELGYLPASKETDVLVGGITYRAQVYRHPGQRDIQHIVYAPLNEWDDRVWFERPNTPLPQPVEGYYVSPTGNDTNDGRTPETAWKTIGKAALSMPSGETVRVIEGAYPERVQVTKPGVYLANGVVTCKGFTVKADNVETLGFKVQDTPDNATDGWGIHVTGDNCLVSQCQVEGATRGGIMLAPGSSNCWVMFNWSSHCSQVGIEVHGTGNNIQDNDISGTVQHHPKSSETRWLDADGIRFFGSGHVFRGNYIYDITYDQPENVNPHIDAFQTWSDEWHAAAENVLIEDNCIHLLVSQAPNETGHGFMFEDSKGIVIRGNVVKAACGVETGGAGGGTNSNLTVAHNTFVNNLSFPYTGGVQLVGCINSAVQDNIFYNVPSNYIGAVRVAGDATGVKVDHNLYYRTDGGSHSAPVGVGDIRGKDPLFEDVAGDNYGLLEGSPAIGAASDGGDIGAVEADA